MKLGASDHDNTTCLCLRLAVVNILPTDRHPAGQKSFCAELQDDSENMWGETVRWALLLFLIPTTLHGTLYVSRSELVTYCSFKDGINTKIKAIFTPAICISIRYGVLETSRSRFSFKIFWGGQNSDFDLRIPKFSRSNLRIQELSGSKAEFWDQGPKFSQQDQLSIPEKTRIQTLI